mgnify:CR=1 FL=1
MKNKVMFITGAAGAIGFEIAKQFAENGAMVVMSYIDSKKLEDAAATLGRRDLKILGIEADLTDENQIKAALDETYKRYGGIDAVLIWPTYPNIGIDNRNQYDLVQDMPGGIEGIRQMIADFKKRGVRVFFPIMIWDNGTRKIALAMPDALMKEMKIMDATGMNGDTMWGVTEDFRHAYDSLGHPIVLQPEVAINDLKMVAWNTSSWGYYWSYAFVPGISIYK